MLLRGKTAVVTGCNRGIGKAISRLFVQYGANLWACARRPSDEFVNYIDELTRDSDGFVFPIYFDFNDLNQVKTGAKEIVSEKKPIDILVNNAGMIHTAPFQMTSVEKTVELFNVNFLSHMVFTQYIVRNMARQKSGSIVNIASSAAIEGNEGRLSYVASKAALLSSTKVMARELSSQGIRVNVVAPGLTLTDMMIESTPEDALNEILQRIIMKRVGTPEEIAQVVAFLASNMSSYMTGQVIRVDGGM